MPQGLLVLGLLAIPAGTHGQGLEPAGPSDPSRPSQPASDPSRPSQPASDPSVPAEPVDPFDPDAIFLPPPPPPLPPRVLEMLTETLEIEAGQLNLLRREQQVRATGGVEMRMGDRTLLAQAATVDLKSSRVRLEGPVYLLSPDGVLSGEGAELTVEPLTGVVYRGRFVTAGGSIRLSAARIERDEAGRFTLVEGDFTPCDCPPPPGRKPSSFRSFLARPSWSVKAKRVRLTLTGERSGRVRFEKAWLRVKDLPVFYLPWGELPVGDRRVSGLLAPELRQNEDGVIFRLPLYLVTGPASDLTLGLAWYGARGFKPDLELRYLTGRTGGGELDASWLYDLTRAEHRGALSWRHESRHGRSIQLLADLNEVSDPDYLRDFGGELEVRSREFLSSMARASWQAERWQAILGLEHYTGLVADSAAAVGRMPELRLAGRGPVWRGGWGALEMRGTARAFYETAWPGWGPAPDVETGGTGRWYGVIDPSISWGRPLGAIGTAKGSIGYTGAVAVSAAGEGATTAGEGATTAGDGTVSAAGDGAATRQAVQGRLELSTALARTWHRPGRRIERLHHRIEPSIGVDYQLWGAVDPEFVAPIGEPVTAVRELYGRVTQRWLGRYSTDAGGRRADLGAFTLGAVYGLDGTPRFTAAEGMLELRSPVVLRVASRLSLPDASLAWVLGNGRYAAEGGWLELGYGWIAPGAGVAGEEAGVAGEEAVSELHAAGGVKLETLFGGTGAGRWLAGWSLEGRARIGLSDPLVALSRRLSLRYDSPCRCFSAQLFVALERDQETPDLRAKLTPTLDPRADLAGSR